MFLFRKIIFSAALCIYTTSSWAMEKEETTEIDYLNAKWDFDHTIESSDMYFLTVFTNSYYNHDKSKLLICCSNGVLTIFDSKDHTTNEIKAYEGSGVRFAKFSSDGHLIITTSNLGSVKIWDLKGTLIYTFSDDQNGDSIHLAAFYGDNNQVITNSKNNITKAWKLSFETRN